MSANTLPTSPSIEQLKNQAKDLLASFRSHEPTSVRRVESALRITPFPVSRTLKLADAQRVVAREYGFSSWPRLSAYVVTANEAAHQLPQQLSGDPDAIDAYDNMIDAFRNAQSLAFTVTKVHTYKDGSHTVHETMSMVLRKPDQIRYESQTNLVDENVQESAIVFVNGTHLVGYWPNGRPAFFNEIGTDGKRNREHSYYETTISGPDIVIGAVAYGVFGPWPEMSPTMFFWAPKRRHIRITSCVAVGSDRVDGVDCHIIDLLLKADLFTPTIRVWIAVSDHLPRRSTITVGGVRAVSVDEHWQDIAINREYDDELFHWQPSADWSRWEVPEKEVLIAPGTAVPDIRIETVDGHRFLLSQHKGRVIAIVFGWTMPKWSRRIQRLHDIGTRHGVVVIAWDSSSLSFDELKPVAQEHDVEYPICKCQFESDTEKFVKAFGCYANPSFVIIDENGIVAESWIHDFDRFESTVERLAGLVIGTGL